MKKARIETLLYNAIMSLYDEGYTQQDVICSLDITVDELISITYPQYKKKEIFEALELFKECDNILDASRFLCRQDFETSKMRFVDAIATQNISCINHYINVLKNEIIKRRPTGRCGCYDFDSEREIEAVINKLQGRL